MRCLCSGKSESYTVTVKPKFSSTQKVVRSSVQNGISTSSGGASAQASATTNTIPSSNGVETSQTTTHEVQVHSSHKDDITRYHDTSKTVAKEFPSISTSKSSTPEGTLKNKPKAPPQPTTSESHVTSHKATEIHVTSPQSETVSHSASHVTFSQEATVIHSSNEPESHVTSHKATELHVTSPQSETVSESASHVTFSQESTVTHSSNTASSQIVNGTESSHYMPSSLSISVKEPQPTTSEIQMTSYEIHAASPQSVTVRESSHKAQSVSVTPSSHDENSLDSNVTESSRDIATSHNVSATQPPHDIANSYNVNITETSYVSLSATEETSRYTSSTVTGSKSETFLVPSPTNTLIKSPSVSSTERLSSSTAHLSLENLENLTNGRKGSVGELIAGSNRSSTSLEENEARRRSGIQVSVLTGPEVTSEEKWQIFKKSPEDEENIRKAIEKNEFLSKILSGKRLQDIINAMQPKNVIARQKLVKQGDKGSEMFVSKEGTYKVLIKGKVVAEFHDTRVFGELAILYNAKRLASIQAATTGKVWVLDRHVYQKIVISSNLKEQDENLKFLQNVESLNVVNVEVLRQVSNLLKPEFFVSGTVIIKQGDKGDKFYIIRAGTVSISKTGEGVLGKLGKGQCFGEMALQKEDTRQATVTAEAPGVECLTLTRADFINHFGDVEIPKIEVKKTSFRDDAPSEYQDIKLEDLKIVKTLGVGGFGRVELVQHKKRKDLVFALKYLKKIDIVYQNQQEHVYNEKLIQMNSRSPFVVRLYRTYKDNKYVYFLMESCLGGDLFSLLHRQKGKRFEERDARFLSACVLEALEHLHSKGVVYRDLKPENLLIDKNGYLKLTDFGFAKKMPSRGKTFTFAGTPEYVAPEIVLNRGHDKAVDYWAFGSFIFELLTGRTPFRTGDSSHMRTYNKILNGIDNVNFPTYMNPKARNLIEKLCRPVPSERLGMQRGGTRDIKAHKWYQGFDWVRFQQCQIPSSFKPKLRDLTDTSNFDLFKQDKDYPPDETSGWDIHF